jgi:hypothetical protein
MYDVGMAIAVHIGARLACPHALEEPAIGDHQQISRKDRLGEYPQVGDSPTQHQCRRHRYPEQQRRPRDPIGHDEENPEQRHKTERQGRGRGAKGSPGVNRSDQAITVEQSSAETYQVNSTIRIGQPGTAKNS